MSIDHDQICKTIILAFFREFMWLFCPDQARLIDFSRVEFLREEYFTDLPRGKRRLLDLVVKVGLLAGGEKFVLVHVEFEASRKEPDFPLGMYLRHCQLFLRHRLPVIPVAMFTDDAVWKVPVPNFFEVALPNKTYVRFEYHLIKLRHLDYRQFLKSSNPLAYALMAKMNYNRRDRVRLKADFLRWILGSEVDAARQSLLVEFVETYMPLKPAERIEFEQIVVSEPKYRKVEKMITTYEQVGIEKGIEKGKQHDLIMLLEKKFRKLKAAEKRRIQQIDSTDKLNRLLLSVLDASSLDELEF